MFIKQVSIFIENKKGKISDCINILAKNNINIHALSVADTETFGILRLIVDNPDKAYDVLKASDYTCKLTQVIGVYINDQPGGLAEILNIVKENNIDVNYLYAFAVKNKDKAIDLMRFDDPDKALKVLKDNKVSLVDPSDIY